MKKFIIKILKPIIVEAIEQIINDKKYKEEQKINVTTRLFKDNDYNNNLNKVIKFLENTNNANFYISLNYRSSISDSVDSYSEHFSIYDFYNYVNNDFNDFFETQTDIQNIKGCSIFINGVNKKSVIKNTKKTECTWFEIAGRSSNTGYSPSVIKQNIIEFMDSVKTEVPELFL